MKIKKCTKCLIEKSISDFGKAKHGKFGVRGDCKLCNSKRVSKYNSSRPNIKEIRDINNKSDASIFSRYRYDATRRSRNYEFNLTFEQFSELINKECHYCPIYPSRGVDRVNNKQGYILENCVPCCARCNEMKMDKSLEEFYSHIDKIYHKKNQKLSKV